MTVLTTVATVAMPATAVAAATDRLHRTIVSGPSPRWSGVRTDTACGSIPSYRSDALLSSADSEGMDRTMQRPRTHSMVRRVAALAASTLLALAAVGTATAHPMVADGHAGARSEDALALLRWWQTQTADAPDEIGDEDAAETDDSPDPAEIPEAEEEPEHHDSKADDQGQNDDDQGDEADDQGDDDGDKADEDGEHDDGDDDGDEADDGGDHHDGGDGEHDDGDDHDGGGDGEHDD